MARAVWSGSISFGLVNVPVKAYAAVHDHSLHFNQLDPKGNRISYKKVSSSSGREVGADDIQMGYEISKGHYVTFEPDELTDLRPRSNKSIEISDFVELDQIDPVFYDHTYWLGPDGDAAAEPYALLASALDGQGKVGIGTVVIRTKQYLGAVRPQQGGLALSTMRFADEIVALADVTDLPKRSDAPNAKHVKLAAQIIDALSTEWEPERYHDTYTEEVRALIEAKANGEEITVESEPEGGATVVDLMEALQASVDEARNRRSGGRGAATSKAKAKAKAPTKAPTKARASRKKPKAAATATPRAKAKVKAAAPKVRAPARKSA